MGRSRLSRQLNCARAEALLSTLMAYLVSHFLNAPQPHPRPAGRAAVSAAAVLSYSNSSLGVLRSSDTTGFWVVCSLLGAETIGALSLTVSSCTLTRSWEATGSRCLKDASNAECTTTLTDKAIKIDLVVRPPVRSVIVGRVATRARSASGATIKVPVSPSKV